jgi:hypothetical protein
MKKEKIDLGKWLALFGVIILLFHLLPAFLTTYVQEPITDGDVLDFITPFAVIAVAFLLYSRIYHSGSGTLTPSGLPDRLSKISLGLGFVLYVEGHGIHLSANSLARLFDRAQYPEFYHATYFFDEIFSHYIWDAGVFLISLALIFACYRIPPQPKSTKNLYLICGGAVMYGFTFAANGIEGQTVAFVIPAALVGLVVSSGNRFRISQESKTNPVRMFFLLGYAISLILFAYWGIRHAGFPQFSELGWI